MASHFVWHDLMTTDPEKAKAFYTQLFGWTLDPQDMGEFGIYDGIKNGDTGLGGIVPLDAAHGLPSHWMSYLQVKDTIEETCARATELGGTVVEPIFEIPNVGKMAVVKDPQGAHFSPFEPAPGQESDPPNGMPPKGGVAWHELLTTDPAAAANFYTGVTGLTSSVQDMGTGSYTLLMGGERDYRAGIFEAPDGAPVAWLIYFEIAQDSMEEALAEAQRLGGDVRMGAKEVPGVGTIAVAADPTGAMFSLMKSAPMPG